MPLEFQFRNAISLISWIDKAVKAPRAFCPLFVGFPPKEIYYDGQVACKKKPTKKNGEIPTNKEEFRFSSQPVSS